MPHSNNILMMAIPTFHSNKPGPLKNVRAGFNCTKIKANYKCRSRTVSLSPHHVRSQFYSAHNHRYSPSSLSSFAHSFDAAWKRVVERDAWPDSRAFLSAICAGAGSGSGATDDPSNAPPAGTDVINFDAVGQPRRRRVGLILTTTKKRGRINSPGGATSKGRRRSRFSDFC